MTVLNFFRRKPVKSDTPSTEAQSEPISAETTPPLAPVNLLDIDISPGDPFLAYCQSVGNVIEVDRLMLDSPAVAKLKANGTRLVVPLVSQGELIGLINVGSRLSDQEYSSDDRKLLADLAVQAAPAVRVAQLVRQQQLAAAERERTEQELRVARLIQQTLLPQALPQIADWAVDAYYQPARAVGGDFYDFIYFDNGRIGFIVADVTDKGVPAALVMATTRSILRAAAERLEMPGAVLERTNNVLVNEIPPNMFVTCFYALLDPQTGHLRYANAGHDVPYHYSSAAGIQELRATGMPLGLMPAMVYEEKETTLSRGDYFLLYSDGLVEAHNPARDMFGFPHLKALLADRPDASDLNSFLLAQLADFTGPNWEQEDDVTLVTVQSTPVAPPDNGEWQLKTAFDLPSAPGNERQAMAQVAEAIGDLLPASRLEKLKTAVAEATMNAMEHGNRYDPDLPAMIQVAVSDSAVRVRITDHGGGAPIADDGPEPDLLAKLAGEQSPRGWGLFLIQNMVDEMAVEQDLQHHTIVLKMAFEAPTGAMP